MPRASLRQVSPVVVMSEADSQRQKHRLSSPNFFLTTLSRMPQLSTTHAYSRRNSGSLTRSNETDSCQAISGRYPASTTALLAVVKSFERPATEPASRGTGVVTGLIGGGTGDGEGAVSEREREKRRRASETYVPSLELGR